MRVSARRWAVAACCAASLLASPGCIWLLFGAAAGVGSYAYVNGELTREYAHSQEETFDAAADAVDDMGLSVVSRMRDDLMGKLECTRVDGKSIVIRVEPFGSTRSRVSIRVGTFGEKQTSVLIADKIEERL